MAEAGPQQEAGKKVSWAELFYDLVFVFAVTEVSTRLETDHSAPGLIRALVAFVPVYWVWVGTTLQANMRDTGRPTLRLAIFVVALSGLFMALAIPYAFEGRGLLFAVAYWAGRVVLGSTVLRQVGGWNPYGVSMFVTGPLLTVGALLPVGGQMTVWAAAAALDLASPSVFRRRLKDLHYDPSHLAERFGLFVLIALGESVVGIGLSAQLVERLDLAVGLAVSAAFALSCGLWWVYFAYASDAVRHALATATVQLDITRLVLSYGHLSFIASIIAVAVGMREAVAEPTVALGWSTIGFLYGGAALYLTTFGYTRWTMFRRVATTRLTAAVVVLVVLPVAQYVSALLALTLLAVILAVLNVVEWHRVERPGWRPRLTRRR